MKEKLLLLYTLTLSATTLTAQNTFRLSLYSGIKMAKAPGGEVYLFYIDESPSQDRLESEFSIPEMKSVVPIGFRGELTFSSNFVIEAGLSYLTGAERSGVEYYGAIGFAIDKIRYRFAPKIGLIGGYLGYTLGDIYQNDLFIQVNNQRFYSQSVSVKLKETFTILRPCIDFSFPTSIGSDWEIFMTLGYSLPTRKGSPFLEFNGEDINQTDATAKESVQSSNVYLTVNNRQIKGSFNKMSGIFFQIGVNYAFSRD